VARRQTALSDEEFEEVDLLGLDPAPLPLVEQIRFLQFRYWSGTNWVEAWNSSELPAGVEVSLGPEPATNDMVSADFPVELFQRVIYLPGTTAQAGKLASTTPAADDLEPGEEAAP
jgi:hypothetical protein